MSDRREVVGGSRPCQRRGMRESFLEDCPESDPRAVVARLRQDEIRKIRTSRRYKEFRAGFRARCAAVNAPCSICLRPIPYELRDGPARFEMHHVIAVALDPSRLMDERAVAASHGLCNRLGTPASAEALGLPPDGPPRPAGAPPGLVYSPTLGWPSEVW